jgi:hypothetical protein
MAAPEIIIKFQGQTIDLERPTLSQDEEAVDNATEDDSLELEESSRESYSKAGKSG